MQNTHFLHGECIYIKVNNHRSIINAETDRIETNTRVELFMHSPFGVYSNSGIGRCDFMRLWWHRVRVPIRGMTSTKMGNYFASPKNNVV